MPFNTDSLSDAQTEDIVRAYLKRKGESTYKIEDLITRFFLRVVSCMHVPRGLADGAGTGSQQAYFKFELPSGDEALLEALTEGLRFRKKGQTYHLDSFGKIEWRKSRTSDSFASFACWEIYQWARLHERNIEAGSDRMLHGSVKLVSVRARAFPQHLFPPRRHPLCAAPPSPPCGACSLSQAQPAPQNAVMILPPLILEVVRRSYNRVDIEVTFNIGVRNHLWTHIKTPPNFNYQPEEPAHFELVMSKGLTQLATRGYKMSAHFGMAETAEVSDEEDQVYEVDRLLKKRTRRGKVQYLVRWAPPFQTEEHDSWEPWDGIGRAAIRAYNEAAILARWPAEAAVLPAEASGEG